VEAGWAGKKIPYVEDKAIDALPDGFGKSSAYPAAPVGAAAVILGPAGLADLPPGSAAYRGAQLLVSFHVVIVGDVEENLEQVRSLAS
jgi:hypothetical protein